MARVRHTPDVKSTTTPVGLVISLNNEERNVATVSSDELRTAQAADETCQRLLLQTSKTPMYELNKDGLLVRVFLVDGSQQVVVPENLVSSILYMKHYPPSEGHPGAHRMFQTIRRTFFLPRIAEDVYETDITCDVCSRNRIAEKRKTNPLKLFPAKVPWNQLRWTYWDHSREPNIVTVYGLRDL
jgi:Integrase zinc binding domain